MLKRRIIPCLDVEGGRVVKGVRFVDLVDAGDPVEQAKVYDAQGADELCFLDITASHENRETIYDVIAGTAEMCFMPLTVGGGVRTVDDIRRAHTEGLVAWIASMEGCAMIENEVDLVFAAGPGMAHLYAALPDAMKGAHAPDSAALADDLAAALGAGDVVVVKGSRGSRMDRVVDALIALDRPAARAADGR